jgi:hypothetical protein
MDPIKYSVKSVCRAEENTLGSLLGIPFSIPPAQQNATKGLGSFPYLLGA